MSLHELFCRRTWVPIGFTFRNNPPTSTSATLSPKHARSEIALFHMLAGACDILTTKALRGKFLEEIQQKPQNTRASSGKE